MPLEQELILPGNTNISPESPGSSISNKDLAVSAEVTTSSAKVDLVETGKLGRCDGLGMGTTL